MLIRLAAVLLLSAAVSAQSQPPPPGKRNPNRQTDQRAQTSGNITNTVQNPSTPPVTVNVSVAAPEITPSPQAKEGAGYYGTVADWWMVWLTLLTFFATVALVIIAGRQFKKQTDQTTEALCFAKRGLEETIAASKLERRAWMTISDIVVLGGKPEAGREIVVKVSFLNSGATPALEVWTAGKAFLRETDDPRSLIRPPIDDRKGSRSVVGPGAPNSHLQTVPIVPTQALVDGLLNGSLTLYSEGVCFYKDIFNNPHETEFAFKVSGALFKHMDADRPDVIPLSACPDGNNAN